MVGIVLCAARRLQASGASDVQVLVSIDASATQEDPVVLDATELAANLTSVPAATLLETFVSSSLAASLGVTESSVTLESAPVVTTTSAPADSGLSGGGIAGIVIAVVVVAAIIAIAAVVVIKRKKNRGHVAPDATPMTSPAPTSVSQV
ncbi:hypothetical protein EON67_03350 [archaeon]|nr:MAG: hypothetical protein EON67_03350 [archaeon]